MDTIKNQFMQQYPNVAVSFGANNTLEVRVKNQTEANEIPSTFMGLQVTVKLVLNGKAR
jgi:hypothetical protein